VAAYRALASEHHMVTRTELCRALEASPPPAALIAIDGFRTLHPDHEELLLAWGATGAEVVVALHWLPGLAGTESVTGLVERLRDAGARIEVLEESGTSRPAELRRARLGLFAAPEPVAGSGAVTLAVAEGREAEARFIARSVASRIATGSSPEQIAVAFADPARHAAWLRRAFADEGVPAAFSGSMGVGETPLGAALSRLRACAASVPAREDLSTLIRTPFAGVAAAEADATDLAWRRSVPPHGASLVRRSGALRSLIEEARALQGRPIDAVGAKKWKKLADRLVSNAYQGAAPVPGTDGAVDAAVHRALCRHLQEALELGDGAVGSEEFWARFADVRAGSREDEATDRVAVTSIADIALEDRAHVIIGGLTASECPGRGSEDRLEGDAVARALDMLGASVDPGEHLREERRSFFLAVAAAGESLTLTRSGTDDEGSPLRESVFWDEFLDLYRTPGEALDPLSFPHLMRVGAETDRPHGERRASRGVLHDAPSLADLAGITEVSPSEVEAYLSCPYRWFVERRLRAVSPDMEVDPAAAGRFAHDSLAGFYRSLLGSGAKRVTIDSREEAMATAERMAREAIAEAGGVRTLESATLLRSVVPSVASLIGRDAAFLPGYAPIQVEWSFGGSSDVPAIDLGGVALKGRADRIDAGPEGLVVVDYKRTKASSLKEIHDNGLVQLQLYAAAASRTLGMPVAGGVYRGLRDGKDRGFIREDIAAADAFYRADRVDADGIAALIDEAIASAVTAAEDMRSGRIEPTPSATGCRYCAASSFCARAVSG
jgi:RecB family exonuclease